MTPRGGLLVIGSPRKRCSGWLRLSALAALLLVLPALLLVDAFAHEVRPKRLVTVEPGFLYRSGQISPRLIRGVLADLGIGRVVWLLHYDASEASHRAEKEAIESLGVERLHFPLRGDGTGKAKRYADAIAAVAEAKRAGIPVLVHCAAGARRSAGVVALYRLLVEGASPELAYRELDRFGSRPVAESRLLPYLNENMREIAERLVERGAIERVPRPLPLLRPPPPDSLEARAASLIGGRATPGLAGF
jgi:protein tyrosine/serine phosphatase